MQPDFVFIPYNQFFEHRRLGLYLMDIVIETAEKNGIILILDSRYSSDFGGLRVAVSDIDPNDTTEEIKHMLHRVIRDSMNDAPYAVSSHPVAAPYAGRNNAPIMFSSYVSRRKENAITHMLGSLRDVSDANRVITHHINTRHVENGVIVLDAFNTYIDANAEIGKGATIYPNVFIEGHSAIGENTTLFPGCRIINSKIGSGCSLQYVTANESVVEDNVSIGPFVNLRPNTVVRANCKIGDFVEVKNSTLGEGTKVPHLSYVGDSDVGCRVNIGCGTVFVNYDGKHKHRCTVEDDAFIGCNTNLIAPVTVGEASFIAAGSTINLDVPPGALAIARERQTNKPGRSSRLK